MRYYNVIPCIFSGVLLMMHQAQYTTADQNLRGRTPSLSSSVGASETIGATTTATTSLPSRELDIISDFADPNFSGMEATAPNNNHQFQKVVTGPFRGPPIPLLNDPGQVVPVSMPANSLVQDRVIGGRNVLTNEKHYALLLYWNSTHWKWAGCGGTLLSACHVATAAHCLENSVQITGVFTNAIAPYNDNNGKPFHFSFVGQTWTHPNYDDYSNRADIAIIKLQECLNPAEFPYATPADSSYSIAEGTNTQINGFGVMADNDDTLPEVLQQATVPFIPRSVCRQAYYSNDVLDDMVCAGYEWGGTDACQGDSGSGLVRKEYNGDVTHVGIVSWGVGCGNAGSPGVYIAVSYYYDWLHDNICSDVDARASWCNPNMVGYNPFNGRNNGGGFSNIQLAPINFATTPRPTPPPTPPPTYRPPPVSAYNSNSVCNGPGMGCNIGTECCSGVCRMANNNGAYSSYNGKCAPAMDNNKQSQSYANTYNYGGSGGGRRGGGRRHFKGRGGKP